jgi:hypothetical protein
VSVVSHLYSGALGDWCEERLTGSRDVVDQLTEQIRSRGLLRPPDGTGRQDWAQSERTFATRFAAIIQPAPPYSALFGVARIGLASQSWANEQAACYPTHSRLPAIMRERALDMRPIVDGWIDLREAYERGAWAGGTLRSLEEADRRFSRPGFPDEPVLGELFDRTRAYFADHARAGQLSGPGPEAGLARLCWLLAAFKYAYRNDSIDHPLFRLFRHDPPTVAALHAAADDDAIADPLALVSRLRDSGALEQLRRLAGDPPPGRAWGIAAPVIFDHWDENTFILNGPDGATLLQLTAVMTTTKKKQTQRRLWKLVSDAWLDRADTYRIRTVGFYFARQGTLVTWPLASLTGMLTEGDSPQRARAEFTDLAVRLCAEDYERRLAWRSSGQGAETSRDADAGEPG